MRGLPGVLVAVCLAMHASLCGAVTTAGAGTTIVVPVVASTGSYVSEVAVYYPGPVSGSTTSISINVSYYEANGLSSPGLKPCTALTLAIGETQSFQLATQCTLGAGSHFGLLVLQDAANPPVNYFYAFNRTQSVGSQQGFSIEGFPAGNFSGQTANAVGLKRVAAAPGFQTNCFVASLGEAVNYEIDLLDHTGATLGTAITGSLGPWQIQRYLDIFSAAGAAAGDYTNARAQFTATNSPAVPALLGFCTVQDNVYFGADFRVAKSRDGADNGQRRVACPTGNTNCTDVGASPYTITDPTKMDAFRLLIRPPDVVTCTVLGSRAVDLELALMPAGPFGAGTILAGGTNLNTFTYDTGARSLTNNGSTEFYNLEVEVSLTGDQTTPVPYSIRCDSGNGTGDSYRVESNDVPRGF